VGDVTIRDLETIPAGSPFTKTWRIKNEGTCTWTTAYRLIFVAGTPMNTPNWIALPGAVQPGQTMDLSVNLVAPATPGRYEGYWMLQTPAGTVFGVGRGSDQPVWVKIRVNSALPASRTPTSTAGATLEPTQTMPAPTPTSNETDNHLAASACEAQWATNRGALPCPGSGAGEAGSVLPLAQASLEDGSTLGPALMITLPSIPDAYLQGIYPEHEVRAGDRFRARVGCAENAASCSLLFRLGYQDEAGGTHELWSIGEFYDGQVFELDQDLSPLAGQKVRFILGVSSLGSAEGDRAIWVDPRIEAGAAAPTATLPEETVTPAPGQPTPGLAPTLPPAIPTATRTAPTGNPGPLDALQKLLDAIARFIRQLLGS
jgi:hypothetical protein